MWKQTTALNTFQFTVIDRDEKPARKFYVFTANTSNIALPEYVKDVVMIS